MTFVVNKGALLGSTILALAGTVSVHAAPYEVIDLGTLGGDTNFAYGINNLNEVVGSSNGPIIPADAPEGTEFSPCFVNNVFTAREFCNHAFIYRNSELLDLGALNADNAFLFAINDQSTAVGYASELLDDGDDETTDPVLNRAIISFNAGNVETMPYPPESENLGDGFNQDQRALSISNDNQVVGYTLVTTFRADDDSTFNNAIRPYIYDIATETFQILPLFDETPTLGGTARSISSSGEVVGWGGAFLDDGPSAIRALYWNPESPELSTDIGTLGGFSSSAYDINDNGYIVGISDTDENFFLNEELAFVYDLDSEVMSQIPEFSEITEYKNSVAYAINNANQVVGAAQATASFGNLSAAFLWTVGDEELINLNDMIDCESGWDLVLARDINDAGYITGTGTLDGEVRSYLLVPTSDTTPTNCTQQNPDEPVGGGDPDPDPGSGSDSSSGSTSIFGLLLLSAAALFRRRKQA